MECGNLILEEGETVVVSGFNLRNNGDELGLYISSSFGSASALQDYVIWGSRSGSTRESVAVSAGLWTNGQRANGFSSEQSLNKDAIGNGAGAWNTGTTTISDAPTCDADGGVIALENGGTETSICVYGIGDPLNIVFTTDASGSNKGYVITDTDNNILGLPMSGPFDLDGAGVGTCLIWAISFEDDFEGATVGNNISDLTGCFDLSNAVTVYRQSPDGGTLSLADRGTEYANCPGDIVLEVQHNTSANMLRYWYIITDDNNNILGFANNANTSTLDLSGALAGTCRIWGWSYRGEGDPIMGDNISTLSDSDCEAISSNFITVYREVPDGGKVSLANGSTSYIGTAGDIKVEVTHTTSASNLSYWYIITDDNNKILAFANSANTNNLDLSGAPPGTCRIWGWNYRGLSDPIQGDDISTLDNDNCESISENYIEVIREEAQSDIECNTPLNFRVIQRSKRIFILEWDRVSSAKKYQVRLRIEGTTKRFLVTTRSIRMAIRTNLPRSIAAEVRALCGGDNVSDYSDQVTFKADFSKALGKAKITEGQVDYELDANLMSLSPNPANDLINIGFENGENSSQLNIIDIKGRNVFSRTISPYELTDKVDISNFQNGVYQVIISGGGEIIDQQRFIKIAN